MVCSVCSNDKFLQKAVLTERLINEWKLNNEEVRYINRQQGLYCSNCNCSLRSMTLAKSIIDCFSFTGNFSQFIFSSKIRKLKVLEINTAGGLHRYLKALPKYTFVEYPEIDMQEMPFISNSYDVIIHSDTLEHVEDSLTALKENFRVLKEGGYLFYTIPIIFSRMSIKREGQLSSYHGSQIESQGEDYKVITEYGADFWHEIFNAGFNEIVLKSLTNEHTFAIQAKKERHGDIKINFSDLVSFKFNRIIKKIMA